MVGDIGIGWDAWVGSSGAAAIWVEADGLSAELMVGAIAAGLHPLMTISSSAARSQINQRDLCLYLMAHLPAEE